MQEDAEGEGAGGEAEAAEPEEPEEEVKESFAPSGLQLYFQPKASLDSILSVCLLFAHGSLVCSCVLRVLTQEDSKDVTITGKRSVRFPRY